jgi:hypothetical protein
VAQGKRKNFRRQAIVVTDFDATGLCRTMNTTLSRSVSSRVFALQIASQSPDSHDPVFSIQKDKMK